LNAHSSVCKVVCSDNTSSSSISTCLDADYFLLLRYISKIKKFSEFDFEAESNPIRDHAQSRYETWQLCACNTGDTWVSEWIATAMLRIRGSVESLFSGLKEQLSTQ